MATITPTLDTRSTLKSGLHRIKLFIYHEGQKHRVSTKLTASTALFEKYRGNNRHTAESRELRDKINDELRKSEDILSHLKIFSIDAFKKLYNSETGIKRKDTSTNLHQLYVNKINRLKRDEQFSTASNYSCSINNILAYAKQVHRLSPDDLTLDQITVDWLKGFEKWNLNSGNANMPHTNSKRTIKRKKTEIVSVKPKGNSIGTVRCYLRTLRTIFYDSIADHLISPNNNPFGKRGYSVGTSSATKFVLTQDQLSELTRYDGRYNDVRDMFLFLYFANGMNFTDAMHLKKENIHKSGKDEFIYFIRRKTQFSRSENLPIQVHVKPLMKRIMETYIVPDNSYIFNVLSDKMTAEEKHDLVNQTKKEINARLRVLGKQLGFDRLNLKTSRSTFATQLRDSGVPVSYISKLMGHSSLLTTEIYLSSLPSDRLIDATDNLNSYLKNNIADGLNELLKDYIHRGSKRRANLRKAVNKVNPLLNKSIGLAAAKKYCADQPEAGPRTV
jgi:integrase/recombinase XerD